MILATGNTQAGGVSDFQYHPNEKDVELILNTGVGFYGLEERVRGYEFNIVEKWVIWRKIKAAKAMQLNATLNA